MKKETEGDVRKRFTEYGQEHVFRFWDELNEKQQRRLIEQARTIDLDLSRRLHEHYLRRPLETHFQDNLEPAEIIALPKSDKEKQYLSKAYEKGERALAEGSVAALLVAGGQATRLGYRYPKGMYPIGPVSRKTLFQLHAEKIRARSDKYDVTIPWYIMTSTTNHDETVQFFEKNTYFGLIKDEVFFFTQGMIPALDREGKLILETKDHIFMNPDGHGGSLTALKRSGALSDMIERGISLLFYFQVDNVLNEICDPRFLGVHLSHNAEMSAKVVKKRHPLEKVGLIGKVNGRMAVIEYSDMPEREQQAREADGSLKYWAGSIAIHIFNVAFIERITEGGLQLPYHMAFKKIACLDEKGTAIVPDEPNGYKFEQFVFDALGDARASSILEVSRSREFSPVKNATGESSPETAQRDLIRLHSDWLEQAGYTIPRDDEGEPVHPVEISPLFALEKDEVKGKLPKSFIVDKPIYLE